MEWIIIKNGFAHRAMHKITTYNSNELPYCGICLIRDFGFCLVVTTRKTTIPNVQFHQQAAT